jgi:hypothetical protein
MFIRGLRHPFVRYCLTETDTIPPVWGCFWGWREAKRGGDTPNAPFRCEGPHPWPEGPPLKVADFEGLFVLVKPTGSRLLQMKYVDRFPLVRKHCRRPGLAGPVSPSLFSNVFPTMAALGVPTADLDT